MSCMSFLYTKDQWVERVQRCMSFADKEVKTSIGYRKQRGQHNVEKMKEDVAFGKLGEMAVYDYFVQAGQEVTPIDFEIYTGGNKSFDADLYWKGQHVHVKTQSSESAKRYGASWTFQAQSKKVMKIPTALKALAPFASCTPLRNALTLLEYGRCKKFKVFSKNQNFNICNIPNDASTLTIFKIYHKSACKAVSSINILHILLKRCLCLVI